MNHKFVNLFCLILRMLMQSKDGMKAIEESGIFAELGESLALAESVRFSRRAELLIAL